MPVLLEVEFTEWWHLLHILGVVGATLFLYLLWTHGGPGGIEGETKIPVMHLGIKNYRGEDEVKLLTKWEGLLKKPLNNPKNGSRNWRNPSTAAEAVALGANGPAPNG